MDNAYRTHIFGDFAKEFAQQQMIFRYLVGYRSNWRVLHIDGFESWPELPARRGVEVKFFATTTKVDGSSGERIPI